jgi:hypothetical protein
MNQSARQGSADNSRVFASINKVLDYEMTLAEWVGLAAMLSAPYLVIGMVWSTIHATDWNLLWFLRSTLTWPWLMFSGVLCLT